LSIAGGGVGGLFIPLVTQGAILGALVQHLAPAANPALFPTIGIAAFLGAGYRTPLAGVAFVAEATGQPGFLVPALLAAAAAQTVMGRWSFSQYQRGERAPDVRPLRATRLVDIMSPNPDTVRSGEPISEVASTLMRRNRRWVPVLDGAGVYSGLVSAADLATVPQEQWPTTIVDTVVRHDAAPAAPIDPVSTAAARMRSEGLEALAVIEADHVVGVVTLRDIANVEVLVDRLTDDVTEP
jgi:chloride channel protein, CIC family